MFSAAGFDARRDVQASSRIAGATAGVPRNRLFLWLRKARLLPEVIRRPHGRIVFAHSELQGNMNMAHAIAGRHARRATGNGDDMKLRTTNWLMGSCVLLLAGTALADIRGRRCA